MKELIILFLSFFALPANAADLQNLPQTTALENIKIFPEINKSEFKNIWKDTIQKDGYFEVTVPKDYIKIIDDVSKASPKISPCRQHISNLIVNCSGILNYVPTKSFSEEDTRINYIYSRNEKDEILLTIWNFTKNRASITLYRDFLNQSVNGCTATLSLAIDNEGGKLWKLSWWINDYAFELYVKNEAKSSIQFETTPTDVIFIAEKIIKFNSESIKCIK